MLEVKRTFVVDQPIDKVVSYLKDFANTEEWDPGTVSTTRIGTGPVEVGAKWQNVSKFRGRETELEYVMKRDEAARLTFEGNNKTVTATDDLTFRESGDGTEINYHATFDFHGLARLAEPFIKGALEKLGDETQQQMQKTINAR